MGTARGDACCARLASQAEAGKQRSTGDVGERSCTFNRRCRRGGGYPAKDGTGVWTPAAKIASRCAAGGRGRTTAQGSRRDTGNHSSGREAARFPRSPSVEKRFAGTGDYTMSELPANRDQRSENGDREA